MEQFWPISAVWGEGHVHFQAKKGENDKTLHANRPGHNFSKTVRQHHRRICFCCGLNGPLGGGQADILLVFCSKPGLTVSRGSRSTGSQVTGHRSNSSSPVRMQNWIGFVPDKVGRGPQDGTGHAMRRNGTLRVHRVSSSMRSCPLARTLILGNVRTACQEDSVSVCRDGWGAGRRIRGEGGTRGERG